MKQLSMQQHRLAKWWLLEELRTLFLSSDPSEMVVRYTLKESTTADMPSADLQRSLLEQLAFTEHILLKPLDDKTYEVTWQFEFESLYRKQQELVKGMQVQGGEPVEFDDDTGVLTLGTKKAQLPPFKKEHLLCGVMFKYYRVDEPVDTSTVYEKMEESDDWNETAKRMIKDTVIRINKRVDETLGIPHLFKLEKSTIRRTF
jgi:hypothetical protein